MQHLWLLTILLLARHGSTQQWFEVTPAPLQGAWTYDVARGCLVTTVLTDQSRLVEWDGAAWSLTGAVVPTGRTCELLAYDPTSRTVIAMLRSATSLETWSLADGTWTLLAPVSPQIHHLMADPAGGVMLGVRLAQGTSDFVAWNGVQWLPLSPATRPDLGSVALVSDTVRGRILAFGGFTSVGDVDDTWEWNGSDWRLLQPAHRPSRRCLAAMAVDLRSGNVVLHGGHVGMTGAILSDTWTWNGVDWTAASTTVTPVSGPSLVRMAFDRTRNAVVWFGGEYGRARAYEWTGSDWRRLDRCTSLAPIAVVEDLARSRIVAHDVDGIYEYDGFVWSHRPVSQLPPRRWTTGLAHVYTTGQTVLFGGTGFAPSLFGDTWTWDGNSLTQHVAGPQPQARDMHGLAFHPPTNGVVLFGGMGAGNVAFADTWRWNGTQWQDLTAGLTASPPPGLARGLGLDLPSGELILPPHGSASATWLWNGAWRSVTPATMPLAPRSFVFPARDPASSGYVVAGTFGLGARDELWRWAGADWQLVSALPRQPAPMAVDAVHGSLMMLGPWHFRLTGTPATVTRSGSGCGTPMPRIDRFGDRPSTGASDFGLRVLAIPPSAPVLFAMDLVAASIPLAGGCTQLLANPQTVGFVVANGHGHALLPLPVPLRPALIGLSLHAQAAALAAPGPLLGVLHLSERLTLRVGD